MLQELNCHECDKEDFQVWITADVADPGHQILQDSEIVDVVSDKTDAASTSSISGSENELENIPTSQVLNGLKLKMKAISVRYLSGKKCVT
ncbi:unnamed protein product [Parnassius apollo]|uniref:(apollo) hypothetical protein n=1 Tax=Parnassius apollo TaxID=110799 RepID=A0A8S3W045_PARAO|nr:unnamed protein product [Parnassius apollo]